MPESFWNPERDAALREALSVASSDGDAARRMSARIGVLVTKDQVRHRKRALGVAPRSAVTHQAPAPRPRLNPDRYVGIEDEPQHAPLGDERFSRLIELTKRAKGGLTLEALCDHLDLSPKHARALVEDAIEHGYSVDILEGALEYKKPQPSHREVVVESPKYAPGDELRVGVASDLHIASKHHANDALRRHIDWLLESGVRHVFVPGDIVAGGGRYGFLRYEVTETGIEDQSNKAADFFASYGDDVHWHAIAGNHCESFDVGIDAARMIQRVMQERGLSSFHYYGPRAARVRLFDTRFEMWHPGGSLSYALTYKTQRYIDATNPADRPHVLLVGHFHQSITFRRGGVWACLCGTFENGDSSFGRMLGGDVALGGWLLRWRLGADGRIAEWDPKFREYPQTKMQWVAATGAA